MEKRQLRIDVLGTSFVIQSEESAEHLARLTSYVKAKVEEVKGRYAFAEPLTIAILSALNIADEMLKCREEARVSVAESRVSAAGGAPRDAPEPGDAGDEIEKTAARIINRIDDDLLTHVPYGAGDPESPSRDS